jgi:chitosanase
MMNDVQKATIAAIVNVFESGRPRGDYGAIAVIKGDTGHLSYGRSQVSLGSGKLFELLSLYCQESSAKFAGQITPLLPRFQRKDTSLDQDSTVKDLLKQAGKEDPAMQHTQDQFFNTHYLGPACQAAEEFGIASALGNAVVYDSFVQGGWGRLSPRLGKVAAARNEQDWVTKYVDIRKQWLLGLHPPLPSTVYRMDTFSGLIAGAKWELPLPITVHNVSVTQDVLMIAGAPSTGIAQRALVQVSPYMRGDDIVAVQKALQSKGFDNACDGVYGPFTDTLVTKWKISAGITESGVGPQTRKSLSLQ